MNNYKTNYSKDSKLESISGVLTNCKASFGWLDFSDPNTQKEVNKWHMHIDDAKAILKDKDSLIQELENLI